MSIKLLNEEGKDKLLNPRIKKKEKEIKIYGWNNKFLVNFGAFWLHKSQYYYKVKHPSYKTIFSQISYEIITYKQLNTKLYQITILRIKNYETLDLHLQRDHQKRGKTFSIIYK